MQIVLPPSPSLHRLLRSPWVVGSSSLPLHPSPRRRQNSRRCQRCPDAPRQSWEVTQRGGTARECPRFVREPILGLIPNPNPIPAASPIPSTRSSRCQGWGGDEENVGSRGCALLSQGKNLEKIWRGEAELSCERIQHLRRLAELRGTAPSPPTGTKQAGERGQAVSEGISGCLGWDCAHGAGGCGDK